MSYLNTDEQDKAFYAFMAIRLFIYFMCMIANGCQVYFEAQLMTLKKVNAKFFMFLAFSMFCMCRCISQALFFWRPDEYLVGTIYYCFFSLGNFFIFQEFLFLGGFWIQLLYSFFVSSKIRRKGVGRVQKMVYSLALIFFLWQIPLSIIYLYKDLGMLEGIGFVVLLILYFIVLWTNGYFLYQQLKIHVKKSNYSHYNDMMYRTKTILIIVFVTVMCTLAYNIVFIIVDGDGTPPYTLFPIRLIITGIIDIGQMVAIMILMADGRFYKYFLFIRVTRYHPNDKSSASDVTDVKLGSQGTHKTRDVDGASNISNASVHIHMEENGKSTNLLTTSTISLDSSNPNVNLIKSDTSTSSSSLTLKNEESVDNII